MFGKKSTTNEPQPTTVVNTHELQVENERLKIELETWQFKMKQMEEKYSILEKQLKEAKDSVNVERLKSDNETLKKKIADLEFKIANDTSNIEMETENKKLKAQIEIEHSENAPLKELLDTYRAMPDVKNMVESLSGLAIPGIDDLKALTKIISDAKLAEICESLRSTTESVQKLRVEMGYEFERINRRF